MFGLIILAAGLALLLRNMGMISAEVWGILWPVLIIIVGLKCTMKKGCCHPKMKKE
jgi:hypothetical protein